MEDEDFKAYLAEKNCRGCFQHCNLLSPSCGKSKIFIKDAFETFSKEKEKADSKVF